ncbi:MAG: type II toxin-antitoxin system prevent-host-death family antitoxin [Deltaproteobacteria bacterium]|nr:type II toxin-antitoxin system prevent-host-death family antitoxin [Deltaproteobacteria bacterium]
MKIGIREVKNNLSALGQRAHDGERIVVSKNGVPWFEMVPCTPSARNVNPLPDARPSVSEQTAVAPLDETDLPGWQ